MKTSLFEKNLKENTVNINITNFIKLIPQIKDESEKSFDLFENFFRRFINHDLTDTILEKHISNFLRVSYCISKNMFFLRSIYENKSTITYEKKEFLVHINSYPLIFDNLCISLNSGKAILVNTNSGLFRDVDLYWFLWALAVQDPKIYEKTSDLNGKMTFKTLKEKDFVLPISVENFNLLDKDEKYGKYFSEKFKRR